MPTTTAHLNQDSQIIDKQEKSYLNPTFGAVISCRDFGISSVLVTWEVETWSVWDLGKKTCELLCQIFRSVSLSSDYLCLMYALGESIQFLHNIYEGKGGKGGTESLH